jgi:vacuolar-type H+-ATPase subunit E/Vma4
MSLQDIIEKIRASGDVQIQEIEKNTQSQVDALLAQAQVEARQIEADSCATISAPAYLERARILHQARLESLRAIGDVREDLVDSAINRIRERLASIRVDSAYPSVLRMLIQEALTRLNSG